MAVFFSRIFHLRSDEAGIVMTLAFVMFGNSLAQKISEIAAISNFLSDVGPPQFLLVLIASSIIGILMTSVQSLMVDRFDRISMLRTVAAGLGIAFILLRVLFMFKSPDWLNYGLFYLLSDQQLMFFPMAFWVLSNDMFEVSQTKRLFPFLSSWGLVGSLVGIGITALSPALFTNLSIKPEELLMLNILLYFVIYVVLDVGLREVKLRKTRQTVETMKETLSEGWEFVKEVPAFRYLTLSILAIFVCETIIEYRFYVVSELTFNDVGQYQTFLSLFTLVRTVLYLTIQTFLAKRLMTLLDLKNTFLIQPISSLIGGLAMLGIPGVGGAIAGVGLQKLPQYSVDEIARKAFQGLVPEERRGRVSLFMDSYLFAGGNIIGAVLTGIVVLVGIGFKISNYAYGYLAIALLASLVSIWAILKMRTVYDSSLLNWRLRRRQRGKSILDKLDF